MTTDLAVRWPSLAFGEDEWTAALNADRDLYHALLHGIGKARDRRRGWPLSPVEVGTLTLAEQGLTVGEIAGQSHYSTDAVKSRLQNVRRKLGARNTTHAVAIALSRDLIPTVEGQ